MRRSGAHATLAVLVSVLFCATAGAQVRRVRGGQALDASPLVGSGGFNSVTRRGGFSSQLYVTGQVTGLRSFRGGTPYFAANQLNLALPSAGFDMFRRQSVGVAQAVGGGTYRASPYFARSATVFGVRGIVRGRTGPGSSVPRTPAAAARARRLYLDATDAGVRRTVGGIAADLGAGVDVLDSGPGRTGGRKAGLRSIFARPGTTSLFHMAGLREQINLADELHALGRQDKPLDTRVDETAEKPTLPPLPGAKDAKDAEDGARGKGGPDKAPRLGAATGGALGKVPGVDVVPTTPGLVDTGEGGDDPSARAGKKPSRGPGKATKTDEHAKKPLPGALTPPGDGKAAEPPVVLLPPGKAPAPIRSLGGGDDAAGRQMVAAAKLLKAGRYYDADAAFAPVDAARPDSALPALGRALAMFGAGEAYSAGLHLDRAMRIAPILRVVPVDVAAMLGRPAIDRALAPLEARVAAQKDTPESMLLLIAAFVRHNTGATGQAKLWARRLLRVAAKDALLAGYAEFVLTGKRPGRADSSSRPAAGK